jgi:hypothetical protein
MRIKSLTQKNLQVIIIKQKLCTLDRKNPDGLLLLGNNDVRKSRGMSLEDGILYSQVLSVTSCIQTKRVRKEKKYMSIV